MTPVVLGLGSNRSFSRDGAVLEPVHVLREACGYLAAVLHQLKASSVYVTEPMYVTEQPQFYNMAVYGFFDGTAAELLQRTQAVEALLGRDRSREYRNGPRSLDIDIELFGNESVSTPDLLIPHPRILERAFVLVPLLEILPESADISDRSLFAEALKKIGTQGVQKYGRIND